MPLGVTHFPEPMTASERAAIKNEQEAWRAMEKRIAELEAERADLRQRLMGGVALVQSGRYLTAWAEENAKYLKTKTP